MHNFWQFKNQTETSVDLLLYGPIASESWWGDEVTPKSFIEDLNAAGDVSEINVRINSGGGDVFAAESIYSHLITHSAKVNVYVDGMAASAATIIAMAGDKIYIPSGGMMMIHNPMISLWGSYNVQDFEEMKSILDKIKDSIINTYHQRTGKSKDELGQLMSDETWLTGEDAVEQGFADEIFDARVEKVTNNKMCIINSVNIDVTQFKNFPNEAVKPSEPVKPKNDAPIQISKKPQNNLGNKEEESIMNLEELKAKYPDVYKAALNEGIKAERERIKAIDDIDAPGHESIKNEAKYTNIANAGDTAIKILNSQKQGIAKVATNRAKDIQDSGVLDVDGQLGEDSVDEEESIINAVKDSFEGGEF
jgi:ATP-dependent protease ClpP protease subunit